MTRTFLTTSYAEKDAVKALGVRWDAGERKWFVPPGLSLEPFARWLPAGSMTALPSPPSYSAGTDLDLPRPDFAEESGLTLPARPQGQSLSQLLRSVSATVARAFAQGEWVIVEVIQVRQKTHYYLEVSERASDGTVLASAKAMIWANSAEQIMSPFFEATGMVIGPNMKLLVKARPTIHAAYGMTLVIEAIDPAYSLGDLEARKREVRARLQAKGIWEGNQRLDRPWDFNQVLVVSPADAAGLGDFRADADRLQAAGLCEFTYAAARFQGEGAGSDIVTAATRALEAWRLRKNSPPDALVIIRGGGAVGDLAWLNDEALLQFICTLDIPVLCGIGHERDSTLVDEVAHTAFDTPSKVVHGIATVIRTNAQRARGFFQDVCNAASQAAQGAAARTERCKGDLQAGASQRLSQARSRSQSGIEGVRLGAMKQVATAGNLAHVQLTQLRAQAATQVALAKVRSPQLADTVRTQALGQVQRAQERAHLAVQGVREAAAAQARQARSDILIAAAGCSQDAPRLLVMARSGAEGLMREIAGQGPHKTLARGFALVRGPDGAPLTSRAEATAGAAVTLTFRDGQAAATIDNDNATTT